MTPVDARDAADLEEYLARLNLRSARLVALLVMVISPSGILLDLLTHPEEARFLFGVRLLTTTFGALCLWLMSRASAIRHTFVLGLAPILVGAIGIMVMMEHLEGYASPYYAGLSQCILGLGVIFYWPLRQILMACLMVLFVWLGPALLQWPHLEVGPFSNVLFALTVFGSIAVASNQSRYAAATREFQARKEVERSLVQIRELDSAKTRFYANVNHELRTPLTLILAPLETMLNDKSLALPGHVREYLSSMQRSTTRLLHLINNLLDLAKVDAGKVYLRYEPLDLSAFAGTMLPAFEPLAQSKRLTLRLDAPASVEPVYVDAERMDIILQNLLANAMKFTSEGGRITVRVKELPEHVCLEVEDTGIGIAEKDMTVIFERFGQADGSVTRRFGGTGIGLALVKDLVDLHGGEIAVDSVLGRGSTFRVELPKGTAHIREELRDRRVVDVAVEDDRRLLGKPTFSLRGYETPAGVERMAWKGSETGPQILVVEDNPDLQAFLRSILQGIYRVTVASDGQEGLERAQELIPDLILSDVMMPRLSGYELTRAVKADPRLKGVPVILLTAKRGVDPALEGFQHGADDYLGKPFSSRELLARIKVQIDLRELSRQLAEFQKTAMMSTLAAGLAHEVRNPINAIVNGLPAVRMFLPEPPPGSKEGPAEPLMRVLEDSAGRIDRMIVELLDFTNLDRAAFRDWDPNEGVASTLRLLTHRMGEGVRVVADYQYPGTIACRPGPLNQVIMNLLDNAFKAIPEGGEVRVTTRAADGGLELTVSDNGTGIAPQVLPRIFDPFFTTREVGVGTGLGLHLCKQIVQAHQGRLEATSTLGKGATFRIWIPAAAAAA